MRTMFPLFVLFLATLHLIFPGTFLFSLAHERVEWGSGWLCAPGLPTELLGASGSALRKEEEGQ